MVAKKKSEKSEKTPGSNYRPRKETRSFEEFSKEFSEVESILGEFTGVLKEFRDSKLPEVMVDGIQQFTDGKKDLLGYAANVSYAIKRAKIAAGR